MAPARALMHQLPLSGRPDLLHQCIETIRVHWIDTDARKQYHVLSILQQGKLVDIFPKGQMRDQWRCRRNGCILRDLFGDVTPNLIHIQCILSVVLPLEDPEPGLLVVDHRLCSIHGIHSKNARQLQMDQGQQHIAVCQAELTVFKEGVVVKAQVEGVGPEQQMIGHGNSRQQTTGDQKEPASFLSIQGSRQAATTLSDNQKPGHCVHRRHDRKLPNLQESLK